MAPHDQLERVSYEIQKLDVRNAHQQFNTIVRSSSSEFLLHQLNRSIGVDPGNKWINIHRQTLG